MTVSTMPRPRRLIAVAAAAGLAVVGLAATSAPSSGAVLQKVGISISSPTTVFTSTLTTTKFTVTNPSTNSGSVALFTIVVPPGVGKVSPAGVVGDVRHQDTTKEAANEVFIHFAQMPTARVSLAIRTDPDVFSRPVDAEPAVRRAVALVDGTQALTRFAEIQQVISDRIAPKRLSAQLIAIFAGLAGALALIGIYGVLSFTVAQRTHEIGVRMALGANARGVVRMVVLQAAAMSGIGVALGLSAALALTRVAKSLLYGVTATDPSTYVISAFAALSLSMVSASVPALRAARVDPLTALRDE